MERPSHIAFRTSHISRRLPLFALAVFLQVGAAFLIMTGLGHYAPIKDVILRYMPETQPPTIDKMPPPPDPAPVKPVTVPTPLINDFQVAKPNTVTARTVVPTTSTTEQGGGPQPSPPDHAAVAITATHTIPPYPAIAVRQGAQGTVQLRLTILESGRVAKAEIVASSGSEALDQAAVTWIQSHWAYRPAQDHGQPVASQALANVTFNLKDAH